MIQHRQSSWRLAIHEVLPSTSDLCRTLAASGEPAGLAVLARQQTHGRGSRGRDWVAPDGNLSLSVLLRPSDPARDAGQWSLLAAVALADALRSLLPDPTILRLKWPNDVLLDGRKVAGILVDSAATATGSLEWLVLGVGVNLVAAPALPGRAVAALAEFTAPPAPEILAEAFLACLDQQLLRKRHEGFAPVRDAWCALGPDPGEAVTLRVGDVIHCGQYSGLGNDGSLKLFIGGRLRAFGAGEVLL